MGNICDSCRGSTSKPVPAAAANRQVVRPASTTTSGEVDTAQYAKDIRAMADELTAMIDRLNCDPIIVRFAWHDSGTYDKSLPWPQCGGASGGIIYDVELSHGANAGLPKALKFLQPIKAKYPGVSWADTIQLASASAGKDISGPEECPPEGRLPNPEGADHLRKIFYRMGFNDQEIVVLSGAHTIGRAFKDRSGTVEEAAGHGTQYTNGSNIARNDGKEGIGMKGGRSWARKWLKFDNEYFVNIIEDAKAKSKTDNGLLVLESDNCLVTDPSFRKYVEMYAKDNNKFLCDYAQAHIKLSELGCHCDNPCLSEAAHEGVVVAAIFGWALIATWVVNSFFLAPSRVHSTAVLPAGSGVPYHSNLRFRSSPRVDEGFGYGLGSLAFIALIGVAARAALRKDFPYFTNQQLTYLDSAATSQKPQVVLDSMDDFYANTRTRMCIAPLTWPLSEQRKLLRNRERRWRNS
ncbi:hypothetical protein FOZ60_016728 [Perkinsus olseni]|uniref:Plant heme peroxidase family profile domain-containing protein n=1 Tax=Perkinsus olseni TaxID=32597 RepID=A0A7J6P431_PEROL|nr:hypothetical protein FOZ60_016728 [Perkinsus olseni]